MLIFQSLIEPAMSHAKSKLGHHCYYILGPEKYMRVAVKWISVSPLFLVAIGHNDYAKTYHSLSCGPLWLDSVGKMLSVKSDLAIYSYIVIVFEQLFKCDYNTKIDL